MKQIIGMFLGVAIGVTLSLLLTLQLWGNSFWQLTGAVFAGIIPGLFIANPKEAWKILSRGLLSSLAYAKDIGALITGRPKQFRLEQLRKFIPSRLFVINAIIFISLLSPWFIAVYKNDYGLIKVAIEWGGEVALIVLFFALIIYALLIVTSMLPSFWKDLKSISIIKRIMEKIWKGKYEEHEKDFGLDEISPVINELRLNFWSSLIRCGLSSFLAFAWIWLNVLFGVYSFIIWVITKALGIVLSPLFVLRKIAEQNWSLLVSLSITAGALTGTLLESFTWGIGSGLFSLSLLLLLKAVLPINYLHFFFPTESGLNGLLTGRGWE